MAYRRILAVGDIHGHFDKFLSVYRKVHFDAEQDLLVFLGDYIDRGPQVRECLSFVMELAGKKNVVLLRGNHEQMMLDHFHSRKSGDFWLANGGKQTEAALLAWGREEAEAPARVLRFVESLPLSYTLEQDEQRYIFVHAGIRPGVPFEEQKPGDLLWIREEFYEAYKGDAVVIAGHTPTRYIVPGTKEPLFFSQRMILVDTGSYFPDGRVSIVDVLSRRFWQNEAEAIFPAAGF